MQHEIIYAGPLLNKEGNLNEKGFSKKMLQTYNRNDIKAKKIRIKEWDYYLIHNHEYGICLTLDDNGYMSMESVSILDFKNRKEKTVSPIQPMSMGKIGLPHSSVTGDCIYHSKQVDMEFKHIPNGRILDVRMDDFHDGKTFKCHLTLIDEPEESMVIATPFEKKAHFYYNQKIIGFKAYGYFSLGEYMYSFDKEDTRALLDWGRGVWTYENVWYWGAGCGTVDGHEVGFNIGYGFGDTSAASENCIFYDGKMHKLENITFNIPNDGNGTYYYTRPWTITSSDGRFEMNFTPILNRASLTDVKLIRSDQNQIFGYFNGTMILDDGTKVELKDFLAFAERVHNKW